MDLDSLAYSAFSLSAPGRRDAERPAQEFVLFPNEVQPFEAKHHLSSDGYCFSLSERVLGQPFVILFLYFNGQEEKYLLLLTLFYLVLPALFVFFSFEFLLRLAQNECVSLLVLLDSYRKSRLFLTLMRSDAPQAEFPLLIYAALCCDPPPVSSL